MCGIAGIVAISQGTEDVVGQVEAMSRALGHRGPDDAGMEIVSGLGPAVVFGHRRLAIIDLSPAGHQPMLDAGTQNWITFNGEIYNFRQLRAELESAGRFFCSRTDTEVILQAYAAWGAAAWARLQGIFAFALWDAGRRKLHLVRDQLGVKPLYYYRDSERLVFASEVRAMLASGVVPRKADAKGLASYLAYGSVQEPYTLITGVRSLRAGRSLVTDAALRSEGEQCYWRPPPTLAPRGVSRRELYASVRDRLIDAVGTQMVADVPVGVFLSGGIDSVALAYLAQTATKSRVRTFSLVFEEERYDERTYSRLAATHLGTEHTEVVLSVNSILSTMSAAVAALDQPSMDGMNTYFVSKHTRQAGIKVALSGVGGDELFGGYRGYKKSRQMCQFAMFRRAPLQIKALLPGLVAAGGRKEAGRVLAALLAGNDDPYFYSRLLFLGEDICRLLGPGQEAAAENWQNEAYATIVAEAEGRDSINRISLMELRTYMTSTLLRDTDQMTMAHALEVRVPLIDTVLTEFMLSLPGASKLERGQPKPLLTHALAGDIPAECVHRRKGNFELPFAVWLRGPLRPQVEEMLHTKTAVDEILAPQAVTAIWERFLAGQVSWSRVWSVFVLKSWLVRHGVVP